MSKEKREVITDRYAVYQGDSCEILPQLPDRSVDMSCYSPPFFDVFAYTGYDNDLANSVSYNEFL